MLPGRVFRILTMLALFLCTQTECFLLTNSLDSSNGTTNELKVLDLDLYEESRKKKKKNSFVMTMILGALLVKMILLPLAFKAMAVMASVSVLLSAMSLIVSSIVGYSKVASQLLSEPVVKVVHVNDIWAKDFKVPKRHETYDSIEYLPDMPIDQINYSL